MDERLTAIPVRIDPKLSERTQPYTLAVDFDGTICEDAYPEIGAPRWPVIEALRALHDAGWRIAIHTCRANRTAISTTERYHERQERLADMVEWLLLLGVWFDQIWGIILVRARNGGLMYAHDHAATGKPFADVYLDDRSPGWELFSANAQQLIHAIEKTAQLTAKSD